MAKLNFVSRFSLRLRIQAFFFAVILISLVGASFSFVRENWKLEGLSLREPGEHSLNAAGGVISQFYERYGDVRAFAANPSLVPSNLVPARAEETLNFYSQLYGIYELIIVADVQGRVIATNTLSPRGEALKTTSLLGTSVAAESWFQAAVKGQFTEDKEKGFVGTVFETFKKDSWVQGAYGQSSAPYTASFSAPILDSKGQVLGVVSNRANPMWVLESVNTEVGNLRSRGITDFYLELVDAEGQPVLKVTDGASSEGPFAVAGAARSVALGAPEFDPEHPQEAWSFTEAGSQRTLVAGMSALTGPKWPASLSWRFLTIVPRDQLTKATRDSLVGFFGGCLASVIVAMALSVGFLRAQTRRIESVGDRLIEVSRSVRDMGKEVDGHVMTVSSSNAQQAAAIQESVSAMAEIQSMLDQSTRAAQAAEGKAQQLRENAGAGKQVMEEVAHSVADIKASTERLQKVGDLIREIENRTLIINDIVFKTQLLSFNASIEAARAGEQGKGFAVVAEEVGSLAKLSGESAKEIEALLRTGQKEVKDVITNISDRVFQGNVVTQEALARFHEISAGVDTINSDMSLIVQACQQQAAGVHQTNSAMTQMDQSAQRNAQAAFSASQVSKTLEIESQKLSGASMDFTVFMHGAAEPMATPAVSGRPADLSSRTQVGATADRPAEREQAVVDADDESFRRMSA